MTSKGKSAVHGGLGGDLCLGVNMAGEEESVHVEEILQQNITHCQLYHNLLCQHLKEHEKMEAGKWKEKQDSQQSQPPVQDSKSQQGAAIVEKRALSAALLLQAKWRGVCGRRRAAATTIQVSICCEVSV